MGVRVRRGKSERRGGVAEVEMVVIAVVATREVREDGGVLKVKELLSDLEEEGGECAWTLILLIKGADG